MATSGEPQQSNFTALEQQVCTFEDEYCAEAEKDFQFCLVGYFVSEEVLNPRIMRKIWTQWEKVNMIEVDLNTFLFCFPDERSMNLVFSGGPWIFNGKVLLLKRWKIGDPIKDVDISSIDIWVHVFNLPVHLVREESGRKAVGSIAKVIASDRRIESEGGSNYVRVRAQFPVADPLPRGTFIKVRGEQIWLDFRYERIPDICHWCGRLTHESSSCNVVPEDIRSELEEGYGDWLLFHPSSQIVKGEADQPIKTESADQREGKKQQEKGERKRKEDAERKAKLDEIAEKQRQREKELEEKARLEKEALLRRSTEALPRASDNIIPPGRAPPLEHPGAAPAAAAAARGPAPGKYVPAHLRGPTQQGLSPPEADGRGARVPPSRGGIGAKPTSRW